MNRVRRKPDYTSGFEFLTLVVTGLALALVLPLLSATEPWCSASS
jgi:hypothetical protein